MRICLLIAAMAFASACQRDEHPSLAVEAARAQLVPSGVGAVYVDIVNRGAADRLVGARSAASERIEMHEVVHEDGVARMVHHPEGFAIPARGRLELKPGGRHLMLLGLKAGADATEVSLALEFEKSGTVTVSAPVEPL